MECNHLSVLDHVSGIQADFITRVKDLARVEFDTDRERTLNLLEPAYRKAVEQLGFDWSHLARAEQVHGDKIGVVEGRRAVFEGADALITNTPGVLLGIYVADCGAVFIVDQLTGAIGLVHSGKKGTELGIVRKTIELMSEKFGSDPKNLIVVLSPCIRPPAYEVDFASEIAQQVIAAGVPAAQYHDAGTCTTSDLSQYYSYRKESGATGRMLALLGKEWTHVERAPAKVNLSLRVLGKREDGFHALSTRMVPVSVWDTLRLRPSSKYQLICQKEGVPTDESNLVTRAVRVFERETGAACAYEVELEKVIPHGAGLGGGSSDAAALLRALNVLEKTNLSEDQLAEMAAEIGSDVPFFLYQRACDCIGRGELISPLDDWSGEYALLLLKPQFEVSTPSAYQAWQNAEELPGVDYSEQIYCSEGGTEGESEVFVNDLEKPVFGKHFFLAEIKCWLLEQAEVEVAMMSGSGSTMFAVVKSAACAETLQARALAELDPTMWTACVGVYQAADC